MRLRHRARAALAALSVVALGGGAGVIALAPGSEAADATAGTFQTTDWKTGALLSRFPTPQQDDSEWPQDQLVSRTERSVKVEVLSDENSNYETTWRITYNAQALDGWSWKNSWVDYTWDPAFTFAISNDLTIKNNSVTVRVTQDGRTGEKTMTAGQHSNGEFLRAYSGGPYLKDWWTNTASNCLQSGGSCGNALELNHSEFTWDNTNIYGDVTKADLLKANFAQAFWFETWTDAHKWGEATIEFTTVRNPSATQPQCSALGQTGEKTWVMGGWKSYDSSTYMARTEIKYASASSTDTDQDGLPDYYEDCIGSDPTNPDTDGDGKLDGPKADSAQDVKKLTPETVEGADVVKIIGTDPVVGKQERALKTGNFVQGETYSGKTEPNKTIALVNGDKIIAETKSDAEGNYTLTIGQKFQRQDNRNSYGNSVVLNQAGEIQTKTEEVGTVPRKNAQLQVWSDGWDKRPLFSEAESVGWGEAPVSVTSSDPATNGVTTVTPLKETKPAASSTSAISADNVVPVTVTLRDKAGTLVGGASDALSATKTGGLKWAVPSGSGYTVSDNAVFTQTAPGTYVTYVTATSRTEGDVTVSLNDNGTKRVLNDGNNGSQAPSHLTFTTSAVPIVSASITAPAQVAKGAEVTDATVKGLTADNAPAAGGTVYVKVPGSEALVPVTLGEDGTATLPTFTPTDADKTITVYANPDGTEKLATHTFELVQGQPDAGTSTVSAASPASAPVSDTVHSGNPVTFTVTLKDEQGNLVKDADPKSITIAREDGTTDGLHYTVTPKGDGTYTVEVASTKAGETGLVASVNGEPIGEPVAATFTPGALDLSTSTVEVTRNYAAAGGTESNQITVTLRDRFGNPTKDKGGHTGPIVISPVPENWQSQGEVEDPSLKPGGTGVWTFTVEGRAAGTDSATVKWGEDTIGDPVELTFTGTPVDPARSTVEVTCPDRTTANGTDACTVKVTLYDADGTVITDERPGAVQLSLDGADGDQPALSGLTWDPKTHTYTATLTSTKAGTVTVKATAGGVEITGGEKRDATFVPGRLAKATDLTGIPGVGDTPAGQAGDTVSGATVTLTDAKDNPLPPGTVTYVTVPGVEEPVKAKVGDNGVATLEDFTLGGTTAGDNPTADPDATIVVYPTLDEAKSGDTTKGVDTGERPAVTTGPFDPSTSTISVTEGDKPVDQTHTVTVSLKDAGGNPITDPEAAKEALKGLTVDAGDAQVGKFTPVEGKPGTYSAPISASAPGTYTVTAMAGDTPLKDSPKSVTFTAGAPAQLTVLNNTTPIAAGKSTSTEAPVTVTVTDAKGNALGGQTVWITLPGGKPQEVTLTPEGTIVFDDGSGDGHLPALTMPDNGDLAVTVSATADGEPFGTFSVPVKPSKPTDVAYIPQADGSAIVTGHSNNAPSGATVTVYKQGKDGNLTPIEPDKLESAVVSGNGDVAVTVKREAATLAEGESFVISVGEGLLKSENSDPAELKGINEAPTLTGAVNPVDGEQTIVTGTTDPAYAGQKVTVMYGDQAVVVTVGEDGTFEAKLPLQPVGTPITATVGDYPYTSPVSKPVKVVAQEAAPTNVTAVTDPTGTTTTVTGHSTAAPGTVVTVTDPATGTSVTAEVQPDGTFSADITPALPDDTVLTVTVGDAPATSAEAEATVGTKAAQPTGTTAVTTADGTSTTVTGHSTAAPGTVVTVTDPATETSVTAEVQPDGSFSATFEPGLAEGDTVTVTVAGDPDSDPLVVPVVQQAQPAGSATAEVDDATGATTVSGTATPGETVTVTDAQGNVLGETTAGEDGSYSVTLDPAPAGGSTVNVVVGTAPAQSEPVAAVVPHRAAQDVTSVTDQAAGTTTVSGTAPGAADGTKVTITDAAGNVIGTGEVKDGTFTVQVSPVQAEGAVVTVVIGEGAAASHGSTAATVLKPAAPTDVVATATTDGVTATGHGVPGAHVVITGPDGTFLADGFVGSDGTFAIKVPGARAGDKFLVHQEVGGIASDSAAVKVAMSGGMLARTGANALGALLLGGVLVGAGLLVLSRRRRA